MTHIEHRAAVTLDRALPFQNVHRQATSTFPTLFSCPTKGWMLILYVSRQRGARAAAGPPRAGPVPPSARHFPIGKHGVVRVDDEWLTGALSNFSFPSKPCLLALEQACPTLRLMAPVLLVLWHCLDLEIQQLWGRTYGPVSAVAT